MRPGHDDRSAVRETRDRADTIHRRFAPLAWGLAIALLAFNVRIAVNALGVVLPELRWDTHLSATSAGVLLALPTVCFGIVGYGAPAAARRVGMHRLMLLSLGAMVAGQILRAAVPGVAALFAGSVVALAGIAVANILLPSLVRLHFPSSVFTMTAIYTSALMAGLALAAAATLPVQRALAGTWRLGIGMWATVAGVALMAWVGLALRDRPGWDLQHATTGQRDLSMTGVRTRAPSSVALFHSPRAWAMAGFFGLQSLQAYVLFGWLVTILVDGGLRDTQAALGLAVLTALGAPVSAIVPRVMGTAARQRLLLVGATAMLAAGLLGLTAFPGRATWPSIVVAGIGSGALLTMVLTLIAVRSQTAAGTAALSGFSQSIGYLMASLGPVTFGALHDLTGTWWVPMALLLALLGVMVVCGLVAVRSWFIEQDLPELLINSGPDVRHVSGMRDD